MSEAKLTPLAKGLIALTILSVAAAAAWFLGVKDLVMGKDGEGNGVADGTATTDGTNGTAGTTGAATTGAAGSGALGSATNPLKVSIVSFHGYAPALLANGKNLETQAGSIFEQNGVHVKFIIQDNIPTLTEVFGTETAHCAWRTSDFWAQEQPNLRNASLDAKAVVVVDNTQGADAIIARDAAVRRVEDLEGKKVGLLQFTPSHGMVIDAVENSSLSARAKTRVQYVFVNVDEGTAGVRAAFEAGHVDAVALWDPDLSLALQVPGSHVIYSTRTATNLIYDVMVCDQRVLDAPANQTAMQGFVKGWLAGVDAANANPDDAVDALIQTEEFFQVLERDKGRAFVKGLLDNLRWTNLEDNVRILGLAGGTNHYERVYKRFDGIYRRAGALANPASPVINPSDSFDYRYVRSMMQAQPQVRQQAARPEFTFQETEARTVATSTPSVTKPVAINFATGSADLNERSKRTINTEMVPLIENNGSAYIEVSGNTDSTGSARANQRLSQERADAVVAYLVEQWEFPRERFIAQGYGSTRPLCNEQSPEEGLSIDDCRARNRTTRAAVLARQTQ